MVEIHLPGSPPLVAALVRQLVARGARPARPGEFTMRAFLNGRMDLAQAEAVERLISAESEDERRAALEQLEGRFSEWVHRIESGVLDLCADAEAAIDFVDQDIELLPAAEASRRASEIGEDLTRLLAETSSAAFRDDRPRVVLVGRPNSGKSSLFNALTGRDALVSPVAGTTRDTLEADWDVAGGVRLVDTAGDWEATGLDAEAVRRGRAAARTADVLLLVVDASEWEPALALVPRGRPAILVVTKCDLAEGETARRRFPLRDAVLTSARTGEGLPDLGRVLSAMLDGTGSGGAGARFRVDLRQGALLREAQAALDRAASSAPELGMEFVALDLRAALDALGGITGRQVGEDLLDRIFSRFCLGK
jgi:tRNA modification GTPase